MSMKTFLMKKMLASQMKGVPQAEQDKLFAMIEKNPELFQKIALEVQEEIKKVRSRVTTSQDLEHLSKDAKGVLPRYGDDQMTATMEIAKKYESELKGLL